MICISFFGFISYNYDYVIVHILNNTNSKKTNNKNKL